MATTDCYASWHPRFAPMIGGPADQLILRSGCSVGADGNIACAPESMRASAEKQLQASGFWPVNKPLDLGTYTLARNMQSEVGDGPAEERVAVGESTVNHGKRLGAITPQDAALKAALLIQPSRLYGLINAPGGGSAGTGRFTSTSKDPSVLTTLLADLVISGKSENINLGADDQNGMEFRNSFPNPMNTMRALAKSGSYWVGPIPGVDHWRTTQFRKFSFSPTSFEGQQLLARAEQFFGNPVYEGNVAARSMRPVWPANLPICGSGQPGAPTESAGKQFLVGTLLVGSLIGLGWLALRLAKRAAHASLPPMSGYSDDSDDSDDDEWADWSNK